MKRVAYYARVSTSRQEQEATIESQVDEVEQRIKQDGNQVLPDTKFIDNGWTGTILARPALDQLRDAIKRKDFDILYVYDRGRLSRKFVYQELIIEELNEAGIEFVTLHDVNATTPEEKVVQSLEGIFHEWDRIRTVEKFRRGKIFKVRSGKLLGYNPLYGYDYVPKKSKEENGYFVINESEAEVVSKIFSWVGNQGYSLRAVIKLLYELKIYPKKRKREFWTKGPLVRLLQNSSYIGEHYYYKTEAVVPLHPKDLNGKYKKIKKSSRRIRSKDEWIPCKCPVIVEKKIFDRVQDQLKLNQKYASRNKKNNYLLSGLVKCTCGITRVGQKGGKHLYYRCADRIYNYPLPAKCKEGSINVKVLDVLVWKNVVKLVKNEGLIRKQAERWLRRKQFSNQEEDANINGAEDRLAGLAEEEKKYLRAYGAELVSYEVFEGQMKDLRDRRQRIQDEITEQESIQRRDESLSELNIGELCKKAIEKISRWDFSKKEQLLRKIIDKVIASQDLAIVKGYIPVESENINVAFKPIHWNTKDTIPLLRFTFNFDVPMPLKDRTITKRDKLGRIVHSEVKPNSLIRHS